MPPGLHASACCKGITHAANANKVRSCSIYSKAWKKTSKRWNTNADTGQPTNIHNNMLTMCQSTREHVEIHTVSKVESRNRRSALVHSSPLHVSPSTRLVGLHGREVKRQAWEACQQSHRNISYTQCTSRWLLFHNALTHIPLISNYSPFLSQYMP